jgi:hypothetical protein
VKVRVAATIWNRDVTQLREISGGLGFGQSPPVGAFWNGRCAARKFNHDRMAQRHRSGTA